ncbi:MAG TPA: DUF6338 family protein [Verrucomicrobiae bacterium]|nr:DUF6338 family protein [Verrucomicrobiae bacterium]
MFETLTSVAILIVFLVPGYLWRATEGQLVYLDRKLEWEKFAFGLLTRSTIIYLPWVPLLYRGYTSAWYETAPWRTLGFCVLIAFVQPVLFGALWGAIRQHGYDRKVFTKLGWNTFEQSHAPTAWDALFSQRTESWIIETLKDDTKVKGWFGIESHSSSDDSQRDLFISHVLYRRDDVYIKR